MSHHSLSIVEVDNSELLILSPLLGGDHLAEIMVPYQESKEKLPVQITLNLVLNDLVSKLFDCSRVPDVLN